MSHEQRIAGAWRAAVRAEWCKTWSVWTPALWLLATAVICLVTSTTLANDFVHSISVGDLPRGSRLPVVEALGPSVSFATIAVAAFAIHVVTPEYTSGSIGPTFMAQPRRWVVLTAKGLVAAGTGFVLGALGGPATAAATSWVLGSARGDRLSTQQAALGTGLVFASAAMIGVALAFVLRSAVGALSSGFLLLVVTLAAPPSAGRWLPGPAGAAVVEHLGDGRPAWDGMGVLGAWLAALSLLAGWVVAHRDA